MTEPFQWPENPYPEFNLNLTWSASHTSWNQCQAADKAAIEAHFGCSIEEAKIILDRTRLAETRSPHGDINKPGIQKAEILKEGE